MVAAVDTSPWYVSSLGMRAVSRKPSSSDTNAAVTAAGSAPRPSPFHGLVVSATLVASPSCNFTRQDQSAVIADVHMLVYNGQYAHTR